MSSDSHFSTADCEMTEWECANVGGSFFEGVCYGVHPDNCKGKIIRPAHPNFMKSLEEQKEKNKKNKSEAQNLKNVFGVAPSKNNSRTVIQGRSRKERNPNTPRPLTGFMAFSQAERARTPNVKVTAVQISERWRVLTPEQQASYGTYKPTKANRNSNLLNRNSNLLGLYNVNNTLLKFPPREEELKGLFNASAPNKTRSRKRKNRKTLRKRR